MIGLPHRIVPMLDPSLVGEARRLAVALAEDLDFDEVVTGRVALVVTELGNNLLRHARQGQLLLACVTGDDGAPSVEVLSVDHGPGMHDVNLSIVDGHSTGGTSGNGLGAVRRLSNELFDIYSGPSQGTVIVSRISMGVGAAQAGAGRPPAFRCAGIVTAIAGEEVSGDAWSGVQGPDGMALMLADGLGHGPDASEAAQTAVKAFMDNATHTPTSLMEKLHVRLRSTRGAAVALAQVNAATGDIVFCGAGNIAGRLINGVEDRSIMSQHGTAGVQMRTPQAQHYTLPAHGVMVLHSDGLKTRWDLSNAPRVLQRHPALIAAWLWRDHQRGSDDASIVVLQRRNL